MSQNSASQSSSPTRDEWPDAAVIAQWGNGESPESQYATPAHLADIDINVESPETAAQLVH